MDFYQKSREQRIKRERKRRDGNHPQASSVNVHVKNKSKGDVMPTGATNTPINPDKKIDYTAIPDPHMFDKLKRETDEIAAITSKKSVKRQVFSSWTPYTHSLVEPSEELQGTDFELLLQGACIGGHFQFNSEHQWDNYKAAKCTKILNMNTDVLDSGLACIPFYEKLDLPLDMFTLTEVERMNQHAMKHAAFYGPRKKTPSRPAVKVEDLNKNICSILGGNKNDVSVYNETSIAPAESDSSVKLHFNFENEEVDLVDSVTLKVEYDSYSSRPPTLACEKQPSQSNQKDLAEVETYSGVNNAALGHDKELSESGGTETFELHDCYRASSQSPEKCVPQKEKSVPQLEIAESVLHTTETIQNEKEIYHHEHNSEVVDKNMGGTKRKGRRGKQQKKRGFDLDVVENKLESPKEKEKQNKESPMHNNYSIEPEMLASTSEPVVIQNYCSSSKVNKKSTPDPVVSSKCDISEFKVKSSSEPELRNRDIPGNETHKYVSEELEKSKTIAQDTKIINTSSGSICDTASKKDSKKKGHDVNKKSCDIKKPSKVREESEDLDFLLNLKIPSKKSISSTNVVKSSIDDGADKLEFSYKFPSLETKTEDLEDWLDTILDT